MTVWQPGEKGRVWGCPHWPALCEWLSEAPSPLMGWPGPLGGTGHPGWGVAPTSPRLSPPSQHKSGDCFHRGVLARRHSGRCVSALQGVGEPLVTAGRKGLGEEPLTLGWTLPLPQPVGEMDVRGHRRPLVLESSACLFSPTCTLST